MAGALSLGRRWQVGVVWDPHGRGEDRGGVSHLFLGKDRWLLVKGNYKLKNPVIISLIEINFVPEDNAPFLIYLLHGIFIHAV